MRGLGRFEKLRIGLEVNTVTLGGLMKLLNGWSILANILAVLAIVVTLDRPDSLLAFVLMLLPLAVILIRQRRTLMRLPRGVGGNGRYLIARYLLVVAAAVQLRVTDSWHLGWSIVVLVLLLSQEAERVVRILDRQGRPVAANLRYTRTRNIPSFRYGWAFPADLLTLVLLVLTTALPIHHTIIGFVLVALASAVSLVIAVAAGIDALARVQARRRVQASLPQILERISPIFYVYWHAQAGSAFQVAMWLPYLEKLGVPFAIVVRNPTNFREIAAITDRPVFLCRGLGDLDPMIVPSLRGVFYVNNAVLNNHMVRYDDLTHIQLLHGESDKAASTNPVTRMFDLDFVAGQAAIDRFAARGIDMPAEMFRIVGRPQVEDVEPARGRIDELESPTVLYAPTWLGFHADAQYSSLPVGVEIVRRLLDRGCTVVFRPHPYSYRTPELAEACLAIREMLEADTAETGRAHLHGEIAEKEMSVFDCFNASDAMVSDVSSVVGDYLHSTKPIAMVSVHASAEEFVQEFPTSRAAYIVTAPEGHLENIDEVLEDLLGDDPLRDRRIELSTYYLGDIPREAYADRFVDVARAELGVTQEDIAAAERAATEYTEDPDRERGELDAGEDESIDDE